MKFQLDRCLEPFSRRTDTAVILGSGLSVIERSVTSIESLSFEEIPGYHRPSVEGHPGRMHLVREGRSHILLFAGRVHLYEGFEKPEKAGDAAESEGSSDHPVTAAVRLASRLGCKRLLITQAAGSLRQELKIGSWMLAEDIVSLPQRVLKTAIPSGRSDREGVSAVRPEKLITEGFRRVISDAALRAGVELFNGTLFWTTGPCYETPAEARMARSIGADAATMSPLPELLAARRVGLESSCLSWIANFAPNLSFEGAIKHGDIVGIGLEAATGLLAIIRELSR